MSNSSSFEQMLEDSLKHSHLPPKGSIIETVVLQVTPDSVVVDISGKTEANIPKKEFSKPPKMGDTISVYVEGGSNSYIKVSYAKALKQENVPLIREAFEQKTLLKGTVKKALPKGFLVDVMGWEAFLPLSQASLKREPLTEDEKREMLRKSYDFSVLSLEEKHGELRILLTLRGHLEQERVEKKRAYLQKLSVGEIVSGKIIVVNEKNALMEIAPDCVGLVRKFDISWNRIQNPMDVLKVGQVVEAKILDIDLEKLHILLSIKDAKGNIWEQFIQEHPIFSTVTGTIELVESTYLIIKIQEGIQGILHISNVSWGRSLANMKQLYEIGQKLDVMIIKIDPQKRKIDFGLKQMLKNPWEEFEAEHPIGSSVTGTIVRKSPFALFVEVGEITGMLHKNDLSWDLSKQRVDNYSVGASITARVVSFSKEDQRFSLALKEAKEENPWQQFQSVSIGDTLSAYVKELPASGGAVLSFSGGLDLTMPENQIPRDIVLKPQDQISVLVTDINSKKRILKVSMRALAQKEQKETVSQYIHSQSDSSDIDSSLGDALSDFFAKKSK